MGCSGYAPQGSILLRSYYLWKMEGVCKPCFWQARGDQHVTLCRFYLMSPKHCHAFVGYLEEEAVKTCESLAPLLSSLVAHDTKNTRFE